MTDDKPRFQTVPAQEPLAATDTPPKRRGRPPGSKNTGNARGRPRASLEPQIRAFLTQINFVAMVIPQVREDRLDDAEIALVAQSIDEQCRTSPRFRKYIEGMLAAGSSAGLISVVAMIVARRAARHNIIPNELDNAIGTMMASQTGKNIIVPAPPSEPEPELEETLLREPISFANLDEETDRMLSEA